MSGKIVFVGLTLLLNSYVECVPDKNNAVAWNNNFQEESYPFFLELAKFLRRLSNEQVNLSDTKQQATKLAVMISKGGFCNLPRNNGFLEYAMKRTNRSFALANFDILRRLGTKSGRFFDDLLCLMRIVLATDNYGAAAISVKNMAINLVNMIDRGGFCYLGKNNGYAGYYYNLNV